MCPKKIKQADFVLNDRYALKLKFYLCVWMTVSLIKTGFCMPYDFKFFKGCLPQILLVPFLEHLDPYMDIDEAECTCSCTAYSMEEI